MSTDKKPARERVDVLLVERGLAESRQKAQARVLAGEVVVDDQRVDKPSTLVSRDSLIRLKGSGLKWVSRGGLKLEAALDTWSVPVQGAVCVDVGASTGGFTDVLLARGAERVYAVDVGRGQLHEKIRTHPKVVSMERTHIVELPAGSLAPPPSVAVIDVSFISLLRVLPAVVPHLVAGPPGVWVVALVKPQFEVGPTRVGKGGIVRDTAARQDALQAVMEEATRLGFVVFGSRESPITGTDGNVEFLLCLHRG